MPGIITLTTDFGLCDGYVAAVKGVILGLNPDILLVDVSHQVPPGDIAHAGFILASIYEFFPKGTIHLAVVDPGVGTKRRAVILRTPQADFVAPDNGLLSHIIERYSSTVKDSLATLSSEISAVEITNCRLFRQPVSATFHGLDIFAPVAARLAAGTPIDDFGLRIDSLRVLERPEPSVAADGTVRGHVQYIDHFGNLVTDIGAAQLPVGKVVVELLGRTIDGISQSTYGDSSGLLAIIGSSGFLEVAIAGGSAQSLLGASIGDGVSVRGRG